MAQREQPRWQGPLAPLAGWAARFFRLEAASGILLLLAAAAALALANSSAAAAYQAALHHQPAARWGGPAAGVTVHQLINEGLMTLFFFMVGLEIKRELVQGELRTVRRALLPALAALGGMAAPALVYLALNRGGPGARGWAIPTATDIAFAVGCLTLLRGRVPPSLVVFLTALAIFDDLGGIAVIAVFYGQALSLVGLALAALAGAALYGAGRAGLPGALLYPLGGLALWYLVRAAGLNATVAGVALAFLAPAAPRLEAALHPLVAFGIMPLFALANAGVRLEHPSLALLGEPVALGALLGLLLGKQVGIFGTALLATRLGLATPPEGATTGQLYGAAVVGGIGFTVALFVATLAFADQPELLAQAKVGILAGSALSGAAGLLVLRLAGGR